MKPGVVQTWQESLRVIEAELHALFSIISYRFFSILKPTASINNFFLLFYCKHLGLKWCNQQFNSRGAGGLFTYTETEVQATTKIIFFWQFLQSIKSRRQIFNFSLTVSFCSTASKFFIFSVKKPMVAFRVILQLTFLCIFWFILCSRAAQNGKRISSSNVSFLIWNCLKIMMEWELKAS